MIEDGGQRMNLDLCQALARQLRADSIRCSTAAGSGHPTSSLSAADLMAVLLSTGAAAVYRRRDPTTTALYPIVQHHLESFLTLATGADSSDDPVPRWAEDDFRSYLRCGILAYGFARARCGDCGAERLVAFSCCLQRDIMKSSSPRVGYWRHPPTNGLRIVSGRRATR
ncbi:MAG: transposase zinc-binding domain-containing protein [Longimicrobiales bacterium]